MEATTAKTIGLNVLTNSAEATFKTCPRKFEITYRHGIKPAHQANALRIGSCFHEGLEWIKNGKGADAAVARVREMYADSVLPPWQSAEEFYTEEETTVAMVTAWSRRWADDLIVKYVAVELKFDLPLVNPKTGHPSRTFRNQGKIDGIAELPDGRLALVEHKTAGVDVSPTSDYWRKLTMDAQVSRYVLAARAIGYPVSCVAYDVTRKPAIKPKKLTKAEQALATSQQDYCGIHLAGEPCPDRESPTMYGARLLQDMLERPDFYFARMEIGRTEQDLERFKLEQWMIAQQIMHADRIGLFYRNTASCTAIGRCPYFDVCANGIDTEHETPDGFVREDVLHAELADTTNGAEIHE